PIPDDPHSEGHFHSPEIIRDIVLGLSDGGYLAAKSDADHYDTERLREEWEVQNCPEAEAQEII
ncbi:19915_t:CDS:2, partial [Racocetra fulgida]